jgi:DNA replicative helicase MCM subunit Mcm2 (Cdc46/Mcm family)
MILNRYIPSLCFLENSGLTVLIISRFDVISLVRNKVGMFKDELLANSINCDCHGFPKPSCDISAVR